MLMDYFVLGYLTPIKLCGLCTVSVESEKRVSQTVALLNLFQNMEDPLHRVYWYSYIYGKDKRRWNVNLLYLNIRKAFHAKSTFLFL